MMCCRTSASCLIGFWLFLQFIFLVYIVCAWKASIEFLNSCEMHVEVVCAKTSRSLNFTFTWQALICFFFAFAGIRILKTYRTYHNLGGLVGLSCGLANWMLCLSMDYVSILSERKNVLSQYQAMYQDEIITVELYHVVVIAAACSTVLVFGYAVFAAILFQFRNDLVIGKVKYNEDDYFEDEFGQNATRNSHPQQMESEKARTLERTSSNLSFVSTHSSIVQV